MVCAISPDADASSSVSQPVCAGLHILIPTRPAFDGSNPHATSIASFTAKNINSLSESDVTFYCFYTWTYTAATTISGSHSSAFNS
jgi:hypothetical protein